MKSSFVLLSIALLVLSLSSNASDYVSPPSQSPVMSPTSEPTNSDCSSVIYSMVDCLSYLTVGSTDTIPTKPCCDGIKTVLQYNPQCLCSALESSRSMGFDIDNTKALVLSSVCHVPINPHCDVATPPVSIPVSPSVKQPKTSPTKSPAKNPSTTTVTVTIPKRSASLPKASSPSPLKSSSVNLSISKILLLLLIVSSYVYISV